jgi:hypothetical protein
MGFQINVSAENSCELFFSTLILLAQEMIASEMFSKRIVIHIEQINTISIAEMTEIVFFTQMSEEFVLI